MRTHGYGLSGVSPSRCVVILGVLTIWLSSMIPSAGHVLAEGVASEVAPRVLAVELTRKPLARLSPGIVIGQQQKAGFSDLVTLVQPRLASGHINSLPEFAQRYASMFKFTVLANVKPLQVNEQKAYVLDKVGIGFAMDINGNTVVVTKDTANKYGANLGMIDRGVLGGNEDCLEDVIQVARTGRLVIFDAKANMLIDGDHAERVIRHFIWVAPSTGKIWFLVWLLNDNGQKDYQVVSPTMQLLPSGFREDRRIHVSEGGLLSSIPTPDRFALVTIPQGTTVPFAENMKQVAGKKSMTKTDLKRLVDAASESLALIDR